MTLTVVVRSGVGESPPSIILDAPRLVIGRGDSCEVRLPDPSVSHRHASIRQRGTDYIVVDEGSTNGTFVGNVRLSPQAPRVLRAREFLRIGRIWLEIRIDASPLVTTNHAATKELALALVAHALKADGESCTTRIVVSQGPDQGKSLALTELDRPYVLGRAKGCDLVLDDTDASRRHVEFTWTRGGVQVRDLGAKNGTLVGDKRLGSGSSMTLPGGAEIVIGANRLLCEDPISEALAELERAADERLVDGDPVPPPDEPEPREADAKPEESQAPPPPEPQQAPVRDKLRPTASSRPGVRRSWTGTDLLVVLVALLVIGLSLFGLSWLLGSD